MSNTARLLSLGGALLLTAAPAAHVAGAQLTRSTIHPLGSSLADPGACSLAAHVSALRSRRTIVSGGVERHYVLVPPTWAVSQPHPVLLDLHGTGSDPEQELAISGLAGAAAARGFVVVAPSATAAAPVSGATWNVPPRDALPDDVRFIADVLDDIARSICIDRDRVVIAGFSAGARLASHLACTLPGGVAAIAAVGGLRAPSSCDGRAIPVIAFHGTGDPINPYEGGGLPYWGHDVESAFRAWSEHNGCEMPAHERHSESVDVLAARQCQSGADVVLYRLRGGGHTWPGSDVTIPAERFGRTVSALDATSLILSFFARHARLERSAP